MKLSPHSLVKDCHSCRSTFLLRMPDFDSNSSTSKATICSRLSVGLDARSKKEKEAFQAKTYKKINKKYT